jgi:hypothetical protein
MDHLDVSSTVDSTGAFMVTGVATTVVPFFQFFFFNLLGGRPLRKLATKISDLSVLILDICLDVYLSLQTSRTVVFSMYEVKMCSELYNLLYRVFF